MFHPVMIECPVECESCGLVYDGAGHNACPECEMQKLKEKITKAIYLLHEDCPLHALDVLEAK